MLQGISLSPAFGKQTGLTTDVRIQNCCSCLDLICDRGGRTKGSRKFVPGKRHPPIPCFVWRFKTNSGLPFSRQVIGAVVAQLFWLCMKAVLRFIAKDVVAKGLDHDTFVLSIRSVVSGLLALLKVERDKIGAAPYDGRLRSLVEGIKPFVVRLGVKKEGYELSSRNLTLYARILAKRQILGSRIKVFDTMPRDVRDECAGFRARPRFTPGFRGCDD
ncbi:hypothetical protein DY000_02013746 [Brassica cretica]|uniref:Uncharacterized protein n=1 Tax=Brassica cretica TaxID=69181 RepID=A0ABQ7CLH8_BRACR|nr:hypothetical protein DY000_02013746 [Brassica cretica]